MNRPAALSTVVSVDLGLSDAGLDDVAERAAAEFDASDGTTYSAEEVFGPIREELRRRMAGHDV